MICTRRWDKKVGMLYAGQLGGDGRGYSSVMLTKNGPYLSVVKDQTPARAHRPLSAGMHRILYIVLSSW